MIGRSAHLIEQMTYSRVEVRKEEIFPSSHTTTSISDEIVRGCDLPALDLMATCVVAQQCDQCMAGVSTE